MNAARAIENVCNKGRRSSSWSWNATSDLHLECWKNLFFAQLSTSTMMLLLNRHLTNYKWYFVCDLFDLAAWEFSLFIAIPCKRLLKRRIFIEWDSAVKCLRTVFALFNLVTTMTTTTALCLSEVLFTVRNKKKVCDCYRDFNCMREASFVAANIGLANLRRRKQSFSGQTFAEADKRERIWQRVNSAGESS